MKRFQNRENFPIESSKTLIGSLLLFLGIFLLFSFGVNNVQKSASQAELKNLKQAVQRGVVHCYATEGHYPENLEYLETNYGLQYDKNLYFIGYETLGQNIMPDIVIIPKASKNP